MEKRHLSKIILWETLYVAVIGLSIGLAGGILLSKMMYLVLLKILSFKVQMGFELSVPAILASLLLFGIIFLLSLLNNIRQIHIANPIELIKGGQTGEKEPKTKWLLTLFGLICLGGGYYIAVTTKEPLQTIFLFFVAVILVIIGTYCLFTAGSIAFLKILRKNKGYYYKTKHFISVSGMMYRMKQNAVGLANICILSTMVLVMLSSTVSLYIGMEDVIRSRYPRNITITSTNYSEKYNEGVKALVDKVLKDHKLTAKNSIDYRYIEFSAMKNGSVFTTDSDMGVNMANISDKARELYIFPLEDYNRLMNRTVSLKDNEILIYTNRDKYKEDDFSIFNKNYRVKEHLDTFLDEGSNRVLLINSIFIVVKDMKIVEELNEEQSKAYGEDMKSNLTSYMGFDIATDDKEGLSYYNDLYNALKKDYSYSYVESSAEAKEFFFSFYGGLFFLGIFLGILFMMATILIIYYKQISEGYEDKERFEIMQKVGMSLSEIKKTIHSQVLTVFFLPLVTAVIHIAFAFPVITRLLAIFNLTNVKLFAACTGGTILIFTMFYGIVYAITAREYYKIVK